jgi:hypothetical protein
MQRAPARPGWSAGAAAIFALERWLGRASLDAARPPNLVLLYRSFHVAA